MAIGGVGGCGCGMGMHRPDATQMSGKVMGTKDINGDGLLSSSEVPMSKEQFAAADANNDGMIDKDELLAKITDKMEMMGASLKSEDENQVDLNQFKSLMATMESGSTEKENKYGYGQSGTNKITDALAQMGFSTTETDDLLTTLTDNGYSRMA